MGLKPVAHIGGGFTAWREAGGATEKVEPKKKSLPLILRSAAQQRVSKDEAADFVASWFETAFHASSP